MAVLKVRDDIYSVGVIDWDRKLFDQLIPLPHGTSYNSFVIKGSEKTALVDTVYRPKLDEFISNLGKANVEKLDYIVINHAEPDHSGLLPEILEMHPEARILTNAKCKDLLMCHLGLSEDKFITVENNTEISLGNKTLRFMLAPWVHWPDTMFAYIPEDKLIFTTDFMGAHLATSDLFVTNEAEVYEPAKRYYAEIMMPFRPQVKKYVAQLRELDIETIAPSHGPLYNNPKFILDAYEDWSADKAKEFVVIPYVSMYESTKKMVNYLSDALIEKGIKVRLFNLPETDLGELAVATVDASAIVFGASMVLAAPHPSAIYAAAIVNALKPKTKYMSAIGSYGWAEQLGEKMNEQIKAFLPSLRAEMIDPVFSKGAPVDETYKKLDRLAEDLYTKILCKELSSL